ncbi:unnamed protein product, partial [Polarella glacialis]
VVSPTDDNSSTSDSSSSGESEASAPDPDDDEHEPQRPAVAEGAMPAAVPQRPAVAACSAPAAAGFPKRRRLRAKTTDAEEVFGFVRRQICPGLGPQACTFSTREPNTAAVLQGAGTCRWCDPPALALLCRNAAGRQSLIRDLRFFREHDIQALPAARFPPGRQRELVMTALLLPTAFRTLAATAQALSTPALALKLAARLDKCQDEEAKDMAEQEYLTEEQRATLAEARRQLRDTGPRGTKFCTGLPAEEGQAAVPCQFGPKGKRAQPNGPEQCLFCDVTKLNEAFLNRSADVVRARYNKLTAAAKAMAVDRVTDPGLRQWLATGTGQWLCAGLADPREDCVFALSRAAAAAQTPGKKLRCLFCDPESMAKKCAKAKGLQQVKRDLLRMGLASRRKALDERVPAEHRAALRSVLQQPEPEVVRHRRADTSWVGTEPYTPEELEARYEAGRAKWAPVLAARALVALPDISAEQYRDQVVADRNKSLNMMNVPHERLPRGSEVSNEDPLPKASVTRLAANLQLWCEFNSWQVCPTCQLLQPRVLTPAGLDGLLDPWCGPKACRVCRGLQKPSVPQHESTPAQLAGLSPAARAALCPVEAYYGPEVRARDRFGRGNGYREHSSMVRFSWHQLSVEDRINELSEESRREATRALRWLLRQSGSEKTKSAYGEFYAEHHEFVQRTPDATDRQRKRWLRFLEREGLECALWPDLFLDRQTCLTWVRMQSTSRQIAAHGSTLQERYFPLDEAAGEDDEPIEDTFASTKRAYIALVLSPTLDYSCSYELLHFAYDLNLWTALGAKKNKGLPIPMRLLMRGHSFSEEFWKDMHRALVDLVRQKGFPPVFSTRSPFEWSFPYHVAVVNTMEKARRGRMLLPVHETLHQTHVLTQVGLNFEGGHNKPAERAKKGHEQQLLKLRRPDGGQVKLTSFQRVEFQDGKRKAPTQDYHGSGRAHSHSLEFVGKENRTADLAALQLDRCVSASGSSGDVFVDGYVQASQKDRQGRTPFPLHEGESHFDAEAGRYVLRHTKQDVEDGIRGYYPATMAVTKCHEDVQLCYDDENYTLYTTAYAPKFSDSMRRELLNDDADADSIAASVLMRYKPCEPEMILQLFGAMFRQWRVTTVSGGKRSFTVPVPDNPDQPREVRLYQQCSWRSRDMSMLEFLRKSNNEGGICGWLLKLHRKSGSTAALAAFANTYKMQGEKIVACDMVSRMNDKYYGQWLVLHVPFSSVTDFVKPTVLLLVPAADKYLGMCLACEHAVARSHWHTPRLELLMDEAMAVDRVTDPSIRQWLTLGAGQRRCLGFGEPREECVFALGRVAAAAQTFGKKSRCLFCDPAAMEKKCAKAKGLEQVTRDLLRMGLDSRRKALEERVPAEHRAALQLVLQRPEPEVVRRRGADKSWVGEAPYTPQELEARDEAGRAKWAPVLAARALVALPDISAEQYRDQVVADRNKSLNMMNVPHERLPRGSEVSNEDPLPKASVTRLAANLQLWCEFNSWQVCPTCQLLQPRVLTPAGLDGLLEPWCGPKACRVCRGLQKPSVPQHESTPAQLAGLSPAVRAALSPVEAYYGPEVRARDKFGRGNGYREHSSMVRFSWHQLSVEDRIQELSEESRLQATRALRWLLRQSGSEKTQSAYGEFYEEHREFLQRTPDATDRQRKRWLRFLEREGLECALWPDLFLDRQTCLTWVRMQSTSRQVAAHGSTLQERYLPLDEAAGEGDEPIEDTFASTKRAYIALVLSPTLDYSCSYELLHFAYDLNLWTALGAKKNKGLPIPMRLLMRGHSFSEEFWKDMHRALVDLVRQKGFPPVFSTRSPLEWSFPYHVAVVNTMEKARRGRMLLPVHETLHQTHVLTQVGLNFEGGHNKLAERAKKGHEQQLLKLRRPDGGQVNLTSFQRVEFQDGKRKAPTQDYHGSGRAHSHSLQFVGKENRAADLAALKLDLCVSASGSSGGVFVDGYVQASQKDRQGRTPFPLHEGESHFDAEAGRYVLRHNKQDVEDGIRGYYPATMAVTKCHEDVQLCYDDENYTLYTTAYALKFSDSMRRELLNDDADADSIAASVLMRYKPCEPEMILQLFGAMFRQWRVTPVSGGKRSFTVPVPDNPDQPREVRLYQQCSWRSEDMSMLEFLRKSNNEGGICSWLLELHRQSGSTASLAAFANTYKMQGEKIVACDMVSRMNDKYYGQWLVLHVPFSSVTDFVQPNVLLLVPAADKYLGMCLACEHAVARSHWHTPRLELLMDEDMKLEARTRIYRQQVAARLAPHVKKVLAYLEGTAVKPADPTAQELRAQQQQPARKRHQLPIQRRYEGMIDAGDKTIEGRINHGAAARVMEGDILVLGSTPSLVQAVYTYRSFSAMLEDLGVANALPDVDTLEEALEIYHGFNNYEPLAQLFGVRAFLLAPVPAPEEAHQAPEQATQLNVEQERWAMIVEADIKRAAAVFSATTEREADEAREETWNHNKIRALEGPPGTGKTTIARYVVELAEKYGLKVLWSVYTAQLASRMREVFGDRIDINTCHAALGLDEEYHNVANALQGYGLVVIDEFSQLQGKHIEHINKLRSASDRVAAFVLLGDKCQLAGFGTERVWHTQLSRLPIQRRYEQLIDAGEKTIEGRINHGAAARVMEGDILVLGSTPSLVQAVYTYRSFSAMLEDLGVENALPDVETLEEALEIYHGFNNYETSAQLFGVRAFLLAPVPAPEEADEAPEQATEWNAEQERWAMIVEEDIKRAAAVFSATTERAADEAREETWNHNKIRALEGPPGTGKTTIARCIVKLAETYGLKVLWSVYTAQLASRMREVFGDRIDINTCHAALGLDEEYHNVANALQGYGLVVIDEFSQLQGKHIEHINKLRSASDRVAAFVLLGDKCQLAGFGTERVWHTQTWRDAVQTTELHQLFRCKDPAFKKILACLRTAKPSDTGCRGGVSVPDIMRHRRAWHGHYPTVEAVRSILMKHKNTTMLTVSRQGSATLNDLSLQALYPRRAPLAVISADIESNPEHYNENKELKPVWQLAFTELPLHEGMQVYFTRNVDKSRDFVNGMRATIRRWDASVQALEVRTATGHDVQVFRWTDKDLGNKVYFPVRAGYASTIIKFAGAELPHVTLWLDKPHVPGAAYTGMSRVAYGRDLLIGGNLTKDHFTPAT